MQKIIILLVAYLACTYAVYGNKGACKTGDYKPVDVNWNQYLGKWYNVAVSKSFYFSDVSDKCTVAIYSLNDDGTVKVYNSAIKKNDSTVQVTGSAKIVGPGHLKVSFSKFQPFGGNYEIAYINDDYTVASVVGCNAYGFIGTSDVWILVRDYNIDQATIDAALLETQKLGFDISDVNRAGISACGSM